MFWQSLAVLTFGCENVMEVSLLLDLEALCSAIVVRDFDAAGRLLEDFLLVSL